MKLSDQAIKDLMARFATDMEFKERILAASKISGDKAVGAVEDVLKAEGIEIDAEAHKRIASINWHSNNLGQELGQRVSKTMCNAT